LGGSPSFGGATPVVAALVLKLLEGYNVQEVVVWNFVWNDPIGHRLSGRGACAGGLPR
jgi:hypothetical protein